MIQIRRATATRPRTCDRREIAPVDVTEKHVDCLRFEPELRHTEAVSRPARDRGSLLRKHRSYFLAARLLSRQEVGFWRDLGG